MLYLHIKPTFMDRFVHYQQNMEENYMFIMLLTPIKPSLSMLQICIKPTFMDRFVHYQQNMEENYMRPIMKEFPVDPLSER
jgi:hypothetical protein